MQYEKTQEPRFAVENLRGAEIITIRARRSKLLLLFLGFWLFGWVIGGMAVIAELTKSFQTFALAWLGMWAIGFLAAAATIGWMLWGKETLRVIGSDLEISHAMLGLSRRKLYRGSEIRDLAACASVMPFANQCYASIPFVFFGKHGCIKFKYGARCLCRGRIGRG